MTSVCVNTFTVLVILSTLAEPPVPPVPSLTNSMTSPTVYPSPESTTVIPVRAAADIELILALAPVPPQIGRAHV